MREDNRIALRLKEMAIELALRVAKQELPSIFQSASEEGITHWS